MLHWRPRTIAVQTCSQLNYSKYNHTRWNSSGWTGKKDRYHLFRKRNEQSRVWKCQKWSSTHCQSFRSPMLQLRAKKNKIIWVNMVLGDSYGEPELCERSQKLIQVHSNALVRNVVFLRRSRVIQHRIDAHGEPQIKRLPCRIPVQKALLPLIHGVLQNEVRKLVKKAGKLKRCVNCRCLN